MDKLTLDTNVIRDWAWCSGRSSEMRYQNNSAIRKHLQRQFRKLKTRRDRGDCELGITTQLYTDFQSGKKLPAHIQTMVGPHVQLVTPSVVAFPIAFPIAFVSKTGLQSLFSDVFPRAKWGTKRSRDVDALQLYAHLVAGRDYFVTSDKGILGRQSLLQKKWGIIVLTLDDYLAATR